MQLDATLAREGHELRKSELADSRAQRGMVTPAMMFEARGRMYNSLLGQTDIEGNPLYTPETAWSAAQKWNPLAPQPSAGGGTTPPVPQAKPGVTAETAPTTDEATPPPATKSGMGLFSSTYDPVEATGRELSGIAKGVSGWFSKPAEAGKPVATSPRGRPTPPAPAASAKDIGDANIDAAATPQIKEGTIAVNPKTKERIIMRGGKWQNL
jgi:hypothetical protein